MNQSTQQPLLTRSQCAALRGLAIIGIFLHNYCHWLGFAVKENEYTFTASKWHDLLAALMQPDWNLPIHLLSFFGHYGVPVFLFLSAYGLVMKYESRREPSSDTLLYNKKEESAWLFVWKHFVKLFDMMIIGYVAFTLVDAVTPARHIYAATDVVAQLLMVNNLLPDPDRIIWPGPYWFFGLMLQLYVVYRLLLQRRGWKTAVALVLACWLMQAVCDPEGDALNRIRYNCMGGVLPFCAGLLYARHGRALSRRSWAVALVLSAVGIGVFSANFQLWLWCPLLVCVFSIALVKLLPRNVEELLAWMGGISAALFVLHPITRKIFIALYRRENIYAGLLLYAVSSVALAWSYELVKKLKKSRS